MCDARFLDLGWAQCDLQRGAPSLGMARGFDVDELGNEAISDAITVYSCPANGRIEAKLNKTIHDEEAGELDADSVTVAACPRASSCATDIRPWSELAAIPSPVADRR